MEREFGLAIWPNDILFFHTEIQFIRFGLLWPDAFLHNFILARPHCRDIFPRRNKILSALCAAQPFGIESQALRWAEDRIALRTSFVTY